MFYVYVLKSQRDFKRYIGQTENLQKRFDDHNLGLCKSTKSRRPFELIYFEKFNTRSEAMKRERFFKSGKGREFLKTIL